MKVAEKVAELIKMCVAQLTRQNQRTLVYKVHAASIPHVTLQK